METRSTRNVTATTVTPMGVLGVAVSTTMRFTMAPGAVSVIEEVVGGVVVGGVVVGGVVVGGVVVGGVVVGGVVVGGVVVVVVVEPVVVLIVLAGGTVAATAGVVVVLVPPQPAKPADSALVTNRIIGREQISLKTSYIAVSRVRR
jgi:hypothetical protein